MNKQIILSTAFCFSFLGHIGAQNWDKGFYIKAGSEYALPIQGKTGFDETLTLTRDALGSGIDTTFNKTSFGKGLWASLNVGYYFTPNIGIDVGFQTGVVTQKSTFLFSNTGEYDWSITTTAKMPMLLNPSVAFRLPAGRFSVIAKMGAVLPLKTTLSRVEHIVTYKSNYLYRDVKGNYEITNRFNAGLSCSVGMDYLITDRLCAALEINAMSLIVDTKVLKKTYWETDGANRSSEMTNNELHYEYQATPLPFNRVAPSPIPVSFSHAGLRIGLTYYF